MNTWLLWMSISSHLSIGRFWKRPWGICSESNSIELLGLSRATFLKLPYWSGWRQKIRKIWRTPHLQECGSQRFSSHHVPCCHIRILPTSSMMPTIAFCYEWSLRRSFAGTNPREISLGQSLFLRYLLKDWECREDLGQWIVLISKRYRRH